MSLAFGFAMVKTGSAAAGPFLLVCSMVLILVEDDKAERLVAQVLRGPAQLPQAAIELAQFAGFDQSPSQLVTL